MPSILYFFKIGFCLWHYFITASYLKGRTPFKAKHFLAFWTVEKLQTQVSYFSKSDANSDDDRDDSDGGVG